MSHFGIKFNEMNYIDDHFFKFDCTSNFKQLYRVIINDCLIAVGVGDVVECVYFKKCVSPIGRCNSKLGL
jgi:hypothetical protein